MKSQSLDRFQFELKQGILAPQVPPKTLQLLESSRDPKITQSEGFKSRRLAAYRYAYWARLEESLLDDFPTVKKSVGEGKFSKLSREYFSEFPSNTFSIAEGNRYFPQFLDTHRVSKLFQFLPDLARFEWQGVLSFFAPQSPRLGLDRIETATESSWSRARLSLGASVWVQESHFPLHKIYRSGKSFKFRTKPFYFVHYSLEQRWSFFEVSHAQSQLVLSLKLTPSFEAFVQKAESLGIEGSDLQEFVSGLLGRGVIHSIVFE